MKYIRYILGCLLLLSGCYSVKIETTRPWEGHYFTVEEFQTATKDLNLKDNESVWVISNNTLKRVLKNTGK